MEIEASDRAREYIAEHGGNLYIWADEHDFGHASPEPPEAEIDWVQVPEEGFTLHQDASIGSPDWWKIEYHLLPWPHVTAIWDGGRFGDQELSPEAEPTDP